MNNLKSFEKMFLNERLKNISFDHKTVLDE